MEKQKQLIIKRRIWMTILLIPTISFYFDLFKIKQTILNYITMEDTLIIKSIIILIILLSIPIGIFIYWKIRDFISSQRKIKIINKKLIENIYARPSTENGFNHDMNYMNNIIKPTVEELEKLEKIFTKEFLKEYFKEYYDKEMERKNNPIYK